MASAEVEAEIAAAVGAKRAPKGKAKATEPEQYFDPRTLHLKRLDAISRRQGVEANLMEDVTPMSTGNLMLDLLLGGGLRPGLYINSGFEQSCKTTGCFSMAGAAIKQEIDSTLFDYEGSGATSKPYIANILKTLGIKATKQEIFGVKDDEGRWIKTPMLRYIPETVGEKFFNWVSEVLRDLPDKRYVAKQWWLVYDETKENKTAVGAYADASMNKRYGKGYWVKAKDGKPQALIIPDSFAAMNPENNDEEEANKSLGLLARMFSHHLPRIKGRLAKKMVIILGTNQLREIPMAMYGPKEKEAAGQALRYNSDVRLWWQPLWSNIPFNPTFTAENDEDKLELERAISGGTDRYKYFRVRGFKNKLSSGAGRKVWLRLWVEDSKGEARGFDPFFDTMHYLRSTGQLSGKNRKTIFIKLDGQTGNGKSTDWMTLKRWVLGSKEDMKDISTKLGYKPMDLRKFCFTQIESGKAFELQNATRNSKVKEVPEEAEE